MSSESNGSAVATSEAAGADLIQRAAAGERLDGNDLRELYSLPAESVRSAAHKVRLQRANPELVTYSIYGNIDYTNVCVVGCDFCCYYRSRHDGDAFALSVEEITAEAKSLKEQGTENVLLMGGINPHIPFDWYTDLLRSVKAAHPAIWIDAFSPEEVLGFEKLTGRDAVSILTELKEAGMDALPGVSAEILIDEVRHRVAPKRIGTDDWFRIIDAAFQVGLEVPCVSMVFGIGETAEQRIEHLLAVRDFQDRALAKYGRGFQTFEVWPMRVQHSRLREFIPVRNPDEIATDYLQHVAVARLAMDNIDHHRSVWRTMGFGVAGAALQSGADELSGTGTINAITAVTQLDGRDTPGNDAQDRMLDGIRKCIARSGFNPARRDPQWNIVAVDEVVDDATSDIELAGVDAVSIEAVSELAKVS